MPLFLALVSLVAAVQLRAPLMKTIMTHHNDAASPVPAPYCDAALCAQNQTCCLLDSTNKPGCFAGANATCCGYDDSACPHGFVCDPIKKNCAAIDTSTLCDGCLYVVPYIEDYGCEYACGLVPPPFDLVCDFIVKTVNLCERIANLTTHGLNADAICASCSLCSGGSCKCGYCAKWSGDNRCLSLPNKCPSTVSLFDDDVDTSADNGEAQGDLAFCFNGKCEAQNYGCCLTCF